MRAIPLPLRTPRSTRQARSWTPYPVDIVSPTRYCLALPPHGSLAVPCPSARLRFLVQGGHGGDEALPLLLGRVTMKAKTTQDVSERAEHRELSGLHGGSPEMTTSGYQPHG